MQVDVTVIPCDVNIYNAISINNNSQNDYMVIEYVEYYPNNKLQIFNRNGQLVYLQNNYGADQNKRFYGKGNVGGFLDRSAIYLLVHICIYLLILIHLQTIQ